jgi:hypothetical protein
MLTVRHKLTLTEIAVRGLMERKAIEDIAGPRCPPSPRLQFEVSNFVVLQGIELALNDKDPALPLARSASRGCPRCRLSCRFCLCSSAKHCWHHKDLPCHSSAALS